MKKTHNFLFSSTSLLLASFVAAPAFAVTVYDKNPSLDVYGQLHVSIDYLNAKQSRKSGEMNVSSNASNFGVRGQYVIDENFTVLYQLESTVNIADAEWALNRNSFLGLKSQYGTARVGTMDTPLKVLRTKTDFFPNQIGDARNIVHAAHGQADRRFKNSVFYQTPSFAGFTANVHYSSHEAKGGTQDSDDRGLSSSVEYLNKGFYIGLAHDNTGDNVKNNQQITRLASYYDFEKIKISGLAQHVKDDQYSSNSVGIGARLMVNKKVGLKAQTYHFFTNDYKGTDEKASATTVAAGVDYFYHKNLRFYADAAFTKNKKTALTSFAIARSANPTTVADTSPYAVSVGAVFSF